MPDDSLVTALHDEIDGEEDLHEKARKIVEAKAMKLVSVLDNVEDVEDGLAALAAAVEDELTDLTTEAVHFGRDTYLRRRSID